jgi:O-antigen/teichoic acid export membrane protein
MPLDCSAAVSGHTAELRLVVQALNTQSERNLRREQEQTAWRDGRPRRAGWTAGDQILSSLTNFAITLLVARFFSPAEFGAFTVAYTLYIIVLQLSRSLSTEPLSVRYSSAPDAGWRRAVPQATGVSLAMGLLAGPFTIAAAFLFSGSLRSALLAVGIALPGLLLQDAWRYSFFSQGRPARAAANDFIWAAIQFPVLVLVLVSANRSVGLFILVWGGSALVAAVAGCMQARLLPRPFQAASWLRRHRDLASRFAGEFLVFRSAMQLTLYVVGVVGGLAALASIRAAQVLLGPLNILFLGATAFSVPEAVRMLSHSKEDFRRGIRALSAVLAAAALAWGFVVLALPTSVGMSLLGENWSGAREVLIPVTITVAAAGASIGPWTGLRTLAAAAASLRTRTVAAALTLLMGASGAFIAEAQGAAIGLACASVLATGVWWHAYADVARNRKFSSRPDVAAAE